LPFCFSAVVNTKANTFTKHFIPRNI